MYICTKCGYGSAAWMGKCPNCGEWNSLEKRIEKETVSRSPAQKLNIISLSKVKAQSKGRRPTGIYEFDRVTGGGFVPGEIVLLTGEPGVGKSTLLLQSLAKLSTLYVSGEESADQVAERARRLKVPLDKISFSDTLQVEGILQGIDLLEEGFEVLVIDSIQTVYSGDIDGVPGSVTQIRETTQQLVDFAKSTKTVVILVGHVTKEGDVAGPKTLEHFVDAVLNFEGERVSNFRVLRAAKNRFGATDEIGIFEMKEGGLHEVSNPLVFLQGADEKVSGRATTAVSEGGRTLFFEIQTLCVSSQLPSPRRVVKGVNYNKVLLLLAVIQKHLHLPVDRFDIYINVVGGVEIKSPLSDLGIVASIFSSFKNVQVPKSIAFTGEVGLLGEVREGFAENKITAEAKRLKFKSVYSSKTLKHIRELGRVIAG